MSDAAAAPQEPHFVGHRERLRERFRRGGSSALNDYEFLELILFRAMPRRDVKPIAKALLARFGSFAEVLAARPERLDEIAGLGDAAVTELKIVEAAARRLAQSTIEKRRNLGSSSAVLDYCRTAMAFIDHEEFPLSRYIRLTLIPMIPQRIRSSRRHDWPADRYLSSHAVPAN